MNNELNDEHWLFLFYTLFENAYISQKTRSAEFSSRKMAMVRVDKVTLVAELLAYLMRLQKLHV